MAAFGVLAATAQTASVNRATLAGLATYLGVRRRTTSASAR
jgi:hypothetical protein